MTTTNVLEHGLRAELNAALDRENALTARLIIATRVAAAAGRAHGHGDALTWIRQNRPDPAGHYIALTLEAALTGQNVSPIPALADVITERAHHQQAHLDTDRPDCTGPERTPLVLVAADTTSAGILADAAQWAFTARTEDDSLAWRDILLRDVFKALAENHTLDLRAALVQTAATVLAWIDAINGRTR